jgi:hypothetical protein
VISTGEEHVARDAGTLNVKREERSERERNEKRVDEIKRKLEGKHGQASFVAAEEEKKLEYMNRIKQASLQAWTLNMQSAFKQEDAAEPTSDAEERSDGAVADEREGEHKSNLICTSRHPLKRLLRQSIISLHMRACKYWIFVYKKVCLPCKQRPGCKKNSFALCFSKKN